MHPSPDEKARTLAVIVRNEVVLPPLGRAPSASQPFTELHQGYLPLVEEIKRGLTKYINQQFNIVP
jgi:hypothetical protein